MSTMSTISTISTISTSPTLSTMSTVDIHNLRFEDLHDFWITLVEHYDLGLDTMISLLMTCRNIYNFVKVSRIKALFIFPDFISPAFISKYSNHIFTIFSNIVLIRYRYSSDNIFTRKNIFTEEIIINMAEKCTYLEDVFLDHVSDNAVNAIIINCKNLQKISLHNCDHLKDSTNRKLFNYKPKSKSKFWIHNTYI